MSTRRFMCDFETTVYEGQQDTEVWAAAAVELYTEDVFVFNSLDGLLNLFKAMNCNITAYFHNLKFDGEFWISYLLGKGFKTAIRLTQDKNGKYHGEWKENKFMENNMFKVLISDRGQWYTVQIKYRNYFITIYDSLKLLPISVKRMGESFGTKHKKLEMEYKGIRHAGGVIAPEERKYIENDVLVVKEAMEIMLDEGHDKMTIGACCLEEYKKTIDKADFKAWFPNLYEQEINEEEYGYPNAGEYIKKSYRGAWCYVSKGKQGKVLHNGVTLDVNSLYPSEMHSDSGNYYPVGHPTFWKGDYIPDEATLNHRFYFVRIKTRFYLRPGFLPFIQIKGNRNYKGTECLESSDIQYQGRYYPYWTDRDGNKHDTRIEMVLTMIDFKLIQEHYELVDCEILDGCWFYAQIGLFDTYLDKYKKIKMTSKGAKREISKLFQNNLYGKFAASDDSSFKVPMMREDGIVEYISIEAHEKKPGYIPIGSTITSYARNFTIRACQKNYHGPDKPGFCYADTDSGHMDLSPEDVVGMPVDPVAYQHWKIESRWDTAIFTRQKTYIEHIVEKDLSYQDGEWKGTIPEKPYYDVKCAGMPQRCKDLFVTSMQGTAGEPEEYTEEEREFLFAESGEKIIRTIDDFNVGLKVPGKLRPKRFKGGIVLVDTSYQMR